MKPKIDVEALFAEIDAATAYGGPQGAIDRLLGALPEDVKASTLRLLRDNDKQTRSVAFTLLRIAQAYDIDPRGKINADTVKRWRNKNDV